MLDRTGAELLTQHVVTLVNVSPGADVNAVAALLNPIDAGITAESLQTDLTAANGQPVTAITLRPDDLAPIEDAAVGDAERHAGAADPAAGHRQGADVADAVRVCRTCGSSAPTTPPDGR